MEMRGEYRIPAPRERVWAALNDPEILRASIPGCQSLERHSPTEMTARVVAKVGPVKANFVGRVTLSDLEPPVRYTISGEGQGGVAGFAKGGADVSLAEDGGETVLTYAARAQIGGKLAQLGARLIDSTAKSMADQFFARFSELAAGRPAESASTPTTDLDERAAPEIAPPDGATPYPASDMPVSPATERAREDAAGPSGDPFGGRPETDPLGVSPRTDPLGIPPRTDAIGISPRTDAIGVAPRADPLASVPPIAGAPSGSSAATPSDLWSPAPDEGSAESTAARGAAARPPMQAGPAGGFDTDARGHGATPPPVPKREIPRWVWIAGAIVLVLLVIAALD